MPGMSPQPIDLTNVLIVSLFRHMLFVNGVLWIGGLAAAFLLVVLATRRIFRFNLSAESVNEPAARTSLRWIFGTLWVCAGVLQFQPSMPLGLANNVVAPMAAGTPSWLHALTNHGVALWNGHPVALAVGVAWLQVGIGLTLLTSAGRTGRWVGGLSAAWAGVIWLVGNGAGGIFVSGASILFGWPGATIFYLVAGMWLFLDPEVFRAKFSPYTTRLLSVVLVAGAVLQCLPSAHFWRGGNANALTKMTVFMTSFAQPHALASVVRRVGTISGQMGGGFNIIVVLWLLVSAVGLWLSVRATWRWPVWTLIVGCVVFWVVAEDTALFGGLSTDVNSLLPLAGLTWCAAAYRRDRGPRERRLPSEMTSSAGAVVATFAVSMIVFAAATMGAATVTSAENTLFLAQNGPASQTNSLAPRFVLTDQHGHRYSLGEHAGHATLLTFLDPHCYTDCPLLANQLAQVRSQLSVNSKIDVVAVAANPYHESLSDIRIFMRDHGLEHVRDFYFVTGPLHDVQAVWNAYGVSVVMKPTDKMSVHSDFMFIINGSGRLRWVIPDDPLASSPGTASAVSELKALLRLEGIR
jgi:cytochrome oxidase Cu insertion factor (SCO1/SenC/PrrC family)